ncbi:hypothetical protein BO993_17230 [Xanthomonas oryzae pv. oryzae]|nr:hypothetical protein BO993_17230 [Xanthomonas oryzae pv. oryzae]
MPARLAAATSLCPRVLHQAPIHRMSNGLLLHGGVHDQPFELGGHDGLGGHRGVDGGLEQFLDPGLTDGRAKTPDLRGIAGQARLIERHAAEVLPDHVLGQRSTSSSSLSL